MKARDLLVALTCAPMIVATVHTVSAFMYSCWKMPLHHEGRWLIARVFLGTSLITLLAQAGHANETVTYVYDALGRLVSSSHSGGANSGLQTGIGYDPAGNRSNYVVTGSPPPLTFSISNASVTEGGILVFTISKGGNWAGSVNWVSSNGSAAAGNDFTAAGGTLSFGAGESSKTISIATLDDSVVESVETLMVTLSNPPPGATIITATGTGTIGDNDVPAPSFAISNAPTVMEGGTLVFTVTKNGVATTDFSLNYATGNGSAIAGPDYTATNGILTFASNENTKTISVATLDDVMLESAETVLVTLTGATGGATITTAQASGTINDDDYPPPSFSVSSAASVVEGGTLVFTVAKAGTTNTSYSISFATSDGSATSGPDYAPVSGTLTFAAGETSQTISVSTVNDFTLESAESVLLNLSAPSGGAAVTASQGSGIINDDDYAPPSFAIANAAAVNEGGTLVFTVTKTGTTNTGYSVNFSTANGSAIASSDYTPTSGTLSFAANETSKIVSVSTIDDTSNEGAETVLVNLSAPSGGATITTGQGSGNINASDANTPPIANPDTLSAGKCASRSVNVTANDTDPDGHYPLTLIAVDKPWAWVASSTTIGMETPASNGVYGITYTVRDALGATSTGTLSVTITGSQPCS